MGKHGTRMPIAGLTSASEPNKHNQDMDSKSLVLHPYPDTQEETSNKLLRSQALEPSNCQANTHKKEKKVARRDLARSPAYVPHLV